MGAGKPRVPRTINRAGLRKLMLKASIAPESQFVNLQCPTLVLAWHRGYFQ
jgi:hypothetical protein